MLSVEKSSVENVLHTIHPFAVAIIGVRFLQESQILFRQTGECSLSLNAASPLSEYVRERRAMRPIFTKVVPVILWDRRDSYVKATGLQSTAPCISKEHTHCIPIFWRQLVIARVGVAQKLNAIDTCLPFKAARR